MSGLEFGGAMEGAVEVAPGAIAEGVSSHGVGYLDDEFFGCDVLDVEGGAQVFELFVGGDGEVEVEGSEFDLGFFASEDGGLEAIESP